MNHRIRRDLVEVLTNGNNLPGLSIFMKPQSCGDTVSLMVDVSCWIVKLEFKRDDQIAIFQENPVYLEVVFDEKVFDNCCYLIFLVLLLLLLCIIIIIIIITVITVITTIIIIILFFIII